MKLDERYEAATGRRTRGRMGSGATLPVEDPEVARERRPLESYFQEIGSTRTLKRKEEVILAKELEAATGDLRSALYAIPWSARRVVERWDRLRALQHTGAKLSEAISSDLAGVTDLFAASGRVTDAFIEFNGFTDNSQVGSYAVNVTQLATQGNLAGSAAANLTITTGVNDSLSFDVDGATGTITLSAGTYTELIVDAIELDLELPDGLFRLGSLGGGPG